MQVRSRVCLPVPQDLEQLLEVDHALTMLLIGQGDVLQIVFSLPFPWHGKPPFRGGVHDLCLLFWPDPQLLEQELQEPHCCHTPFTGH